MLYHLSHAPSPFTFSLFLKKGFITHFVPFTSEPDPSISSSIAGITDVYHHTQLNDFSLTVLSPLLALNYHLPDLCLLSEYLGLQVCKELFIK
jgi:hypothetical protein